MVPQVRAITVVGGVKGRGDGADFEVFDCCQWGAGSSVDLESGVRVHGGRVERGRAI